jgi:hypothetical protein
MSEPPTYQDINAAIRFLEFTGDHRDHWERERFAKEGVTAEISSVILARLGANVRTIKNIAVFWLVLVCLGVAVIVLAQMMK